MCSWTTHAPFFSTQNCGKIVASFFLHWFWMQFHISMYAQFLPLSKKHGRSKPHLPRFVKSESISRFASKPLKSVANDREHKEGLEEWYERQTGSKVWGPKMSLLVCRPTVKERLTSWCNSKEKTFGAFISRSNTSQEVRWRAICLEMQYGWRHRPQSGLCYYSVAAGANAEFKMATTRGLSTRSEIQKDLWLIVWTGAWQEDISWLPRLEHTSYTLGKHIFLLTSDGCFHPGPSSKQGRMWEGPKLWAHLVNNRVPDCLTELKSGAVCFTTIVSLNCPSNSQVFFFPIRSGEHPLVMSLRALISPQPGFPDS